MALVCATKTHDLARLVCQNRGFTRISRISPNQRYECRLGIPRITRIFADFSFAVRLSVFVGLTFRLRFTHYVSEPYDIVQRETVASTTWLAVTLCNLYSC